MKWFRIWVSETFFGTTFQELDVTQRGVWFSLLVVAGLGERKDPPGVVEMRTGVAYPFPMLAELVNCPLDIFEISINKLVEVKKIEILPDGRILVLNWSKYQTRYEKYYKNTEKMAEKEAEKMAESPAESVAGVCLAAKDPDTRDVFAYYKEKIQPRAHDDVDEYYMKIRVRLHKRSVANLKQAIDRFVANEWWMAMRKKNNWSASDFFKSDARVVRFMDLRPEAKPTTRNTVDKTGEVT